MNKTRKIENGQERENTTSLYSMYVCETNGVA